VPASGSTATRAKYDGSTLAPYVERQWGPAYGTLRQIKQALDPANVMNPGKLGFPVDGR
jgi:FAD/FMN-containing dehydrogenase